MKKYSTSSPSVSYNDRRMRIAVVVTVMIALFFSGIMVTSCNEIEAENDISGNVTTAMNNMFNQLYNKDTADNEIPYLIHTPESAEFSSPGSNYWVKISDSTVNTTVKINNYSYSTEKLSISVGKNHFLIIEPWKNFSDGLYIGAPYLIGNADSSGKVSIFIDDSTTANVTLNVLSTVSTNNTGSGITFSSNSHSDTEVTSSSGKIIMASIFNKVSNPLMGFKYTTDTITRVVRLDNNTGEVGITSNEENGGTEYNYDVYIAGWSSSQPVPDEGLYYKDYTITEMSGYRVAVGFLAICTNYDSRPADSSLSISETDNRISISLDKEYTLKKSTFMDLGDNVDITRNMIAGVEATLDSDEKFYAGDLSKILKIMGNRGTGTITLMGDKDYGPITSTPITIGDGMTVTLDLNGKNLVAQLITTESNYGSINLIMNQGKMVITDTSSQKNGSINNNCETSNNCTRTIKNTGTMEINAGSIISKRAEGIRNDGTLTISGTTHVLSEREGIYGEWDNACAAVENRNTGIITINGGTLESKGECALFVDSGSGSSVTITGGTFIGSSQYGAVNGSTADEVINATGGKFSSDPSSFINVNSHYITSGQYYEVRAYSESVNISVSSFSELKNAISSRDSSKALYITLDSDITLEEDITLVNGIFISIPSGKSLTIPNDVTLKQKSNITNSGSIIINGFVSYPTTLNGTISGTGIGTVSEGIYSINNAMQLQWLSVVMKENKNITINLNSDLTIPCDTFEPLAQDGFSGTFDGKGHRITDLRMTSNSVPLAMFMILDGATVKDLTIDVDISSKTGYIAGLAYKAKGGTSIQNVQVFGSVNATGASYGVSGIVAFVSEGTAGNEVTFDRCVNNASVGGSYAMNVGSIYGTSSGCKADIGIYNCVNNGNVTAYGSYGAVFGFGYLSSGKTLEICGFRNYGLVNNTTTSSVNSTATGSGFTINIDYNNGYIATNDGSSWSHSTGYIVQFKTNNNSVAPSIIASTGMVNTPTDPVFEGYTFSGWYSDNGLTQSFDFNTTISSDLTLYAKWAPTSYGITYNLDGGTNSESNPATYNIESETITLANPTKNGYTFGGWYTDNELTDQITSITTGSTGAVTVYAKWTLTTYTITYNLNGGTNSASNPAEYTIVSDPISFASPSRSGYTFGGWYTDSSFTTAKTGTSTGETGNITLYAKWTANYVPDPTPTPTPTPTPDPEPVVPTDPVDRDDGKYTESDGSTTTVTTEDDGTKKVVNEIETDKGTTTSEKTYDADGNLSGTTTTVKEETVSGSGNNVTSESVTVTDSEGNTVSETVKVESTSEDGSVKTTLISETSDGTKVSESVTTISVSNEDGNATVKDSAVESAIGQISEVSDNTTVKTITIVTDSKENETSNVTISTESMSSIADAGAELKVGSETMVISMPKEVIDNLSSKNNDISISIGHADREELNDNQQRRVGESVVLKLTATAGDESVHQLGGKMTVTIPYVLKDGENPNSIKVYYVDDDGRLTQMVTKYDETTGTVSFETNHFSYYMIGTESDAEPEPAPKDNTLLYAGVIIAVIAILAVAGFILLKRGKN